MSLICSAGGGDLGSPCVGDRFQVLITVFHNPEMFFCQRVHNAKQLGELVDAMNKRCRATTATLISLPEPGGVCCAQYTGDGKWYRASVLKHTSDDTALVGYLDFGNTETLHISALRPIDIDLLQTPFQAIQCRLAGVKPPSGSWSPEAIFAIGLVLMNKIFSALVISESAGALTLDLVAESSSPPLPVSQYLIAAGLAEDEKSPSVPNEGEEPREEPGEEPRETSSGLAWAQLALNKETEVMVCMLRSPGDFYCHIYNPTDVNSLNDLNVSLGQYCKDHVTESHAPIRGDVCGAFFSEDGSWYRGQVKGVPSGGAVLVQFLDYGNAEEVPMDKLCKIPSSFLELPFQAVRCSLAGVKPAGEMWDIRATETFQKSVARIKLRAKAVSRKEDGYCVQLVVSESGEAVTDVLLADNLAIPDDLKTVGTNRTTAQETGEGGSGSVCDLQEDKLTKETKADPDICPQNGSAHREPDSSHSVQPIKSTQPTDKANSATVTPQEAISLNTTTVLNPPGSAAPTLHGGSKSGYSTSPFQGKHNSNTESSSGNPSPPDFQGKHNSNTDESSSGNPSLPDFQGKCNSNTNESSSGNPSPPDFQGKHNSNTESSSRNPSPPDFQGKYNSNTESSSGNPSPPDFQGKHNSNTESSSRNPSPPDFQGKHNSNTESSSGNPSPPPFQGKYNSNTNEFSSGNPSPPPFQGKYNSNTRKSSSSGNLSPKPFQTIYNSNTKESSPGNLPSIFQRKPNSNVEESSSSGNLPSPPFQRKCNSNTESSSGNPSPPAFQGKYNPNTKDSSSGNHPPCDYRGFRASGSPSPSQSMPVSTYGTRSPIRSGFISAKNSPSSPREMKSTCVSHPPPQAEPPCHESKPPSEKDLPTGDSAQRDVQSSKCPSASQPATSACEDQPNLAIPAREPSSGLLEAGGVSAAQSWTSVDLPMNEPLAAGVIRVRSPDLLYVFPKQNRVDVEKLQEVMTDIFRYCNEEAEHPDYMPCVGDACCAKFTGDGQWYRAVILEVSASTVTVVYADYGNLETLPFSWLRPIKESFLGLPVQITRCRLSGVTPPSHGWSPEETQALGNHLLGAELILTAHSLEAGIYSVSLEKIPGAERHERETLIPGEPTKPAESTPCTQICKGNCVSWRICEELRELRKKVENVELLLEKLMMK